MKKKVSKRDSGDDLLPEYDFGEMQLVGRGIFAKRFRSGTNLALLHSDVRKAFPDDESVNEALRVIAKAAKQQVSEQRILAFVINDRLPAYGEPTHR